MLPALLILMLLTDTHHLTIQSSGNQAQGYYLISGVNDDSVGLVDNSGRFLFALQSGPTTNMQPSADTTIHRMPRTARVGHLSYLHRCTTVQLPCAHRFEYRD